MLPRKQRYSLREHPDFFQTAKKMRGSFFTLFFQTTDEPNAQAVCVVTKKNFPKATARNKVKRQVRALFAPLLRVAQNKNTIVAVVFQPILTMDQKKEFQIAVEKILQ